MTTSRFIGTLNFMPPSSEMPLRAVQEKPAISLDASLFARLLAAREQVRESSQEVFVNSITASARAVFSYVGESLARIAGEENVDRKEEDPQVDRPGGSYHRLHNAIGPAVMVAGMVGSIERAWEKPVYPSVNGKRLPEELTTDEEREEWEKQKKRFESQRAVEVRALKSLAFQYALGAAKAYLGAEANGDDIQEALAAHGVPEDAHEDFRREIVARLKKMPPAVLSATFDDFT